MSALNLQLPDDVRTRLEARAAESGFASVEAYAEAMLRADAAGGPELDDEQLESLLLFRQQGPFVDADQADFGQMRRKLHDRLSGGDVEQGP